MLHNKFNLAIFSVFLYELLMITFNPDGLSAFKVSVTLLVWFSFFLALHSFIIRLPRLKIELPNITFAIFIALVTWNIICVFRGLVSENGAFTTVFGNQYASLALLVPFSLVFGINVHSLAHINDFFYRLVCVGILIIIPIENFYSDTEYSNTAHLALDLFFSCVLFLMPTLFLQEFRKIVIICVGAVFLVYLCIVLDSRSGVIRIFLVFISLISLYLYKKLKLKLILFVAILTFFIPFYIVADSIISGESFFTKVTDPDEELAEDHKNEDSRTFLYSELTDDLIKNNSLIFGKGSSGTYYSPYFNLTGQDTDNRLTVEVGMLAWLLKGGIVSVVLNFSMLFSAIYYAFFKARNNYIRGLGFILLIHSFILFGENMIAYSLYNFTIWFIVGTCLSNSVRSLTDNEIKEWLSI